MAKRALRTNTRIIGVYGLRPEERQIHDCFYQGEHINCAIDDLCREVKLQHKSKSKNHIKKSIVYLFNGLYLKMLSFDKVQTGDYISYIERLDLPNPFGGDIAKQVAGALRLVEDDFFSMLPSDAPGAYSRQYFWFDAYNRMIDFARLSIITALGVVEHDEWAERI